MRLFKLIILVFVFAYLVGIYWYIFMTFFQENLMGHDDENHYNENFVNFEGFNHVIDELSPMKRTILLTYYSVTTLTTVGFGDFYPVSTFERFCASFMMFCGYITFSLMRGQLFDMIDKINKVNTEYNDSENLDQFIL